MMETGQTIKIPYPFCHATYRKYDSYDGTGVETDTWRPGVDFVDSCFGPEGPESQDAIADALGFMLVTIIDIHKPGTYPERVFYVRKWENPDGKVFGKTGLRITTTQAFLRLLKGYRHEFEIAE